MNELNQQEIEAVSGAADINTGSITALLSTLPYSGVGALVSKATTSVVDFISDGIKEYNAAYDSSPSINFKYKYKAHHFAYFD